MHNNMFNYVDGPDEVYRVMLKHMKRDSNTLGVLGGGIGICFAMAWKYGAADGWPWLIGGIVCCFASLMYYIDNSNRNWYLHTIDWLKETRPSPEARSDERDLF